MPLVNADAMLLVDDHKGQIAKVDTGLEEGVRAEKEVGRSVGEAGKNLLPVAALLAAGEHRHVDAGCLG